MEHVRVLLDGKFVLVTSNLDGGWDVGVVMDMGGVAVRCMLLGWGR